MLFDAHTRAFTVLGGIPKRGIYGNMRTAVDKMGKVKERSVNARFESLLGHYLFEAEFCNLAAGWFMQRFQGTEDRTVPFLILRRSLRMQIFLANTLFTTSNNSVWRFVPVIANPASDSGHLDQNE
jgi:hypothetical protein